MDLQEIFDKLYKIFSDTQGDRFHRGNFVPQANLKDDLEVDSLDIVEIPLKMETVFHIPENSISEEDIASFVTVNDIVDFVLHHNNPPKYLEAVDIIKILPHGPGFILVDRVESLEVNMDPPQIRGLYNPSISSWWARDHFPDDPMMPGALMIEGLNQCAGLLLYFLSGRKKGSAVFTGFDKGLIKRQAIPGDRVTYFVEYARSSRGVYKMTGLVEVNGYFCLKTAVKLAKT